MGDGAGGHHALLCNPPEEVFERLRGRIRRRNRQVGENGRRSQVDDLGFRLPQATEAVAEYLAALEEAWREGDTEEAVRLMNFAGDIRQIADAVHNWEASDEDDDS